jgi:hypothetical protein
MPIAHEARSGRIGTYDSAKRPEAAAASYLAATRYIIRQPVLQDGVARDIAELAVTCISEANKYRCATLVVRILSISIEASLDAVDTSPERVSIGD